MRSILVIILFLIFSKLSGSTYYVSITGNDLNKGTFNDPFKTLKKAWSVINAGDTLFIRGGTYNNSVMPPTTYLTNKKGNPSNYIVICNYPGEKPVIDYSDATYTSMKCGLSIENVEYLLIKGIRITNINQPTIGTIAQYGIILWNNVCNCIFEQIETDHIGGWGITIGDRCNNNLFLNCDSHHNADPYSQIPYDWSDGFQSGSPTSDNNTFKGCRAWSNSDDGWDFRLYDGSVTLESCWSFRNGFKPDTWIHGGNGEGFKLGIKRLPSVTDNLRTVINCLAFDNYSIGFHSSAISGYGTFQSTLYNNTSFRNGTQCDGLGFNFNHVGIVNILKNNVSISNPHDYINSSNIDMNNSWNGIVCITKEDFLSLDTAGVSGIRKENGDLPDLNFLKLAASSDLVDAGIDVGRSYMGSAPDMGAFEFPSGNLHFNQLPVINISFSTKGSLYTSPATVKIDIDAFDLDGTIIKVELFNGIDKLGETSAAPYSFTLKDLPEGSYSIRAVATDNLKSTATSSTIEFQVISYNNHGEYFNMYPNPNNGCFSIDFSTLAAAENYIISVVDIAGKIVYQAFLSVDSDSNSFDLSYLNPGTYIVMIKNKLIIATQKFIKA